MNDVLMLPLQSWQPKNVIPLWKSRSEKERQCNQICDAIEFILYLE